MMTSEKLKYNAELCEKNQFSRSQTLFGNAFIDAPRRLPGRRASMNGFPNRVWEPETNFSLETTLHLYI
jgi:hypothetical protein